MDACERILKVNVKLLGRGPANDRGKDRGRPLLDPHGELTHLQGIQHLVWCRAERILHKVRIADSIPETRVWSWTATESPAACARSNPVCE